MGDRRIAGRYLRPRRPRRARDGQDRHFAAAGGSVFRIVEFPPLGPEVDKLSNDHLHHQLGGEAPKRGLPPRHPYMHRTRTIDYAIVMDGEIDMLLDDSEIHMKAGDVLIQQGTNHAWVNRGKETCRIAFILIDSKDP